MRRIKCEIRCFLFLVNFVIAIQVWAQEPSLIINGGSKVRKRIAADPLENLPKNIELLTLFGERADISPDNKTVAFMSKAFGDAMVIDVKTRKINCLTCNIPAAAFLRVMHLSTGDYLLIGPERYENAVVSKRNSDIWYLSRETGAKPVKIGQQVSEGIAVSKINLKIAFTEMSPKEEGKVFSRLVVADLDLTGGKPKLVNRKTVLESTDQNCTVEAQDFYANDTKLTFFCYIPNGAFDVKGVDLITKAVTNFSNSPGSFNEPEGIFPGGRYTTVEMDRQCKWLGGDRGSGNLDIWKLKLDGSGKDLVRLTHFNDYEGGKAANPVVSGDGKFMAFQAARSTDPPGVGHGILLYWFTANTSQVQLKKVTAFKKSKRKESGVK
jgi:Tol biopolymer transport system component